MIPLHDPDRRSFASDNYAGVHPEVLDALAAANGGHQVSYGADAYTARLREVAAAHFGEAAEVFPVFNGTGANVIALLACLPRWAGVVCPESAHINTDENGAPERVGGLKLLTVPAPDGKLTPELIDHQAWGWGDEHRAQPLAVSITQSTELGTLYTVEELRAVTDHAHRLGMVVHVDGARLANAAAALGVPLRALTTDAGVDICSFGGTKNGLAFGEAVVVCNPSVAAGIPFLRKQTMQLPSKMRFVSAQLLALLDGDLWQRSAAHANAMAARLRAAVDDVQGITPTQPTEVNAVFAVVDPVAADRVRQRYPFYEWDPATHEVRWMCSWDTTEADVDEFVEAWRAALGGGPRPQGAGACAAGT